MMIDTQKVGQKLVTKKLKAEKSLRRNDFSAFVIKLNHSHSIVPTGFGVRS